VCAPSAWIVRAGIVSCSACVRCVCVRRARRAVHEPDRDARVNWVRQQEPSVCVRARTWCGRAERVRARRNDRRAIVEDLVVRAIRREELELIKRRMVAVEAVEQAALGAASSIRGSCASERVVRGTAKLAGAWRSSRAVGASWVRPTGYKAPL